MASTCEGLGKLLEKRREFSDASPKKIVQSLVVKRKRKYGGGVTTQLDEERKLRLKKGGKQRRNREYKQFKALKNYIELHELNRKIGRVKIRV